MRQLAEELGVPIASLRRWSTSAPAPKLRRVEVVAERERGCTEREVSARRLRIVTPAGFRIEDLAIDDVLAVVRVLG